MKFVFKILGIIFICFISIIVIISTLVWILLNRSEKVKDENAKIVGEYPTKIQEYLKEKYDKTFIINPDYAARPSGPIPGDTDMPYVYEVCEDKDQGYVFRVYIYPESSENKNIKEISDSYCWKTLGKQVENYLITEMESILPDKYKAIILPSQALTFGINARPEDSMRNLFNNVNAHLRIDFYIITPPINDKSFTEENLNVILNNFYQKYMNRGQLYFYHWETETYNDYKKVNKKEIEKKIFPLRSGYIWPENVNFNSNIELTISSE